MNYNQFKSEWKDAMVYNPSRFEDTRTGECFEDFLQEQYVIYKGGDGDCNYSEHDTVQEFCEEFYQDADLDTHPYMVKSKALESKHVKGLLAIIDRKNHDQ